MKDGKIKKNGTTILIINNTPANINKINQYEGYVQEIKQYIISLIDAKNIIKEMEKKKAQIENRIKTIEAEAGGADSLMLSDEGLLSLNTERDTLKSELSSLNNQIVAKKRESNRINFSVIILLALMQELIDDLKKKNPYNPINVA